MNSHSPQDLLYDHSARSPASHRHQQQPIHRQPSRQFDGYPSSMFPDDQNARYETNRFDRQQPSLQNGGYAYDVGSAQTWNPNAFAAGNAFNSFGATGRLKATGRGRSTLPNTWLDQPVPPMPSMPSMPSMPPFGNMALPAMGAHQLRLDTFNPDPDEELIPTAIVIKNIPFAVRKEELVDLMTNMNLPLPYAFNYHFDNGVFRGLAFANFTSADETAVVIESLNHFELNGRKLRVEYKKMLPLQERERIEREKRERRGQLEEQHRPMAPQSLHNQPSMSSLSSHIPAASPSPVSARTMKPDFDLNDPQTLGFYSEMLLFRDDVSREALIFPSSLSSQHRRTVHTLAHHMGLSHISRGNGEQRQVHVMRAPFGSNISPPLPQVSTLQSDANRRTLNRAATTDFSEARAAENGLFNTLRGQQSTGFLGVPDSPNGFGNLQNLRAAKSFADLRSYTPSPSPSSASIPAGFQANIAKYTDGTAGPNTPTLMSAGSGPAMGPHRDEGLLVNGLGSLSFGNGMGHNSGSPRRLRGMFSWDREQGQPTGPIGSNRNFSMSSFDDGARDRGQVLPMRQPRGPAVERTPGFPRARHNGHQARGSDEIRQPQSATGVEIIVEH